MKTLFLNFPDFMRLAALALGIGVQMRVFAGSERNAPVATLPSLPADVEELKFRDFFVMPIGSRGREMSPKLLALGGRRVRILGYMAQQEEPHPGYFMLAPVPVNATEAFDSMANDPPPATLFVRLPPEQANRVASHQTGLLVLTGTLSVGKQEEVDGCPSMVRLQLDTRPDTRAQLSQ